MSYNDIMRSIRSTFTEGRQLASLRTLTAGHAAWACAAAATLIALAAVAIAVYGALTSGDYRAILSHQTLTPFLAAGFTCIGALVAARHPRNWVGWIFVAAGLMFALIALAAALVSRTTGEGHVCLDLCAAAGRAAPFGDSVPGLQAPELEQWREALRASGVVGAPGESAPLNDPDAIAASVGKRVDAFLDSGPCAGEASTVVDLEAPPGAVVRRGLGDPAALGLA